MNEQAKYRGRCFCGEVEFEVTGSAVGQGYCHCASCRQWSAAPVNAFTLWPSDAVRVIRNADKIATYNKTEKSYRKWCTRCGGHVFTEHPGWKLTDVYASMLPDHRFTPGVHVNYQETVLPIRDGLPKMKDLPKEMGGSGETLPE
jgi:hypothetical protein